MTNIVPIEHGRLRRDLHCGDAEIALPLIERLLDDPGWRDEAEEAFYFSFWIWLEDEDLDEQLGRLDMRIGSGPVAS